MRIPSILVECSALWGERERTPPVVLNAVELKYYCLVALVI